MPKSRYEHRTGGRLWVLADLSRGVSLARRYGGLACASLDLAGHDVVRFLFRKTIRPRSDCGRAAGSFGSRVFRQQGIFGSRGFSASSLAALQALTSG